MQIGYSFLMVIGIIIFGVLLVGIAVKFLPKTKNFNSRKKTIALLLGANIIWISVFGGMFIVLNGPCHPGMFRPNSANPEIYIDSEDSANIYFVSYTNYASGSYDVAYVKFDSEGNIVDGPKFVDNHSIDDYYEESEREITDSLGYTYRIDIREYNIPLGNYNTTASLIYSKIDSNGIVLVGNKTIASHEMVECDFGSHAPAIFGIKLSLDSRNNLHIAWYVNIGPGNYFEVYYMKLDSGGNILMPQTRLYVFDYGKMGVFLGVLAAVPVISVIFYLLRYRKNEKYETKTDGKEINNGELQNEKNREK